MQQRSLALDPVLLSAHDLVDCELLYVLEQHPGPSPRELAQRLAISLGRVNYCLMALASRGWVEAGNCSTSHFRARSAYALTPSGTAWRKAMAAALRKRKLSEYERLTTQIALLERDLSGGEG